jgi:hypothetical protein
MAPKKATPMQLSKDVVKTFLDGLRAEDFGDGCKVKCCGCVAVCTTPQGLATHLKKHGADDADLERLKTLRKEVEKNARSDLKARPDEAADADKHVLSALESSTVSPDPSGDYTQVKCMCGKFVPKPQLVYHLTKSRQHKDSPFDKDVVAKWQTYKDGHAIKHGHPEIKCIGFETKLGIGSRTSNPSKTGESDITKLADAICSAIARNPQSAFMPPPRVADACDRPESQIESAIKIPTTVELRKDFGDHEEERTGKKYWPKWMLEDCYKTDLKIMVDRFVRKRVPQATQHCYTQGNEYYLSLFHVEGECDLIGLFARMYETRVAHEAFKHPLMDPQRSTTRKMVQSLMQCCASLVA